MGYRSCKGIVIKEVNTGEADRIITILTDEYGKISASAKNARRTKNPLAAGTQLLCYSEFMMFKGKELHNISSCEVIESFYEIRNDIVKLTYCSHILELVNDNIVENDPSSEILQLVLNTLFIIARKDRALELIIRIFELRLMCLLGYEPQVVYCMQCEKGIDSDAYFDFDNSSIVCKNCTKRANTMKISEATAKALKYIVYVNPQKLFSFNLSDDSVRQLSELSKRYIKEHLGKTYNKLDYLKNL